MPKRHRRKKMKVLPRIRQGLRSLYQMARSELHSMAHSRAQSRRPLGNFRITKVDNTEHVRRMAGRRVEVVTFPDKVDNITPVMEMAGKTVEITPVPDGQGGFRYNTSLVLHDPADGSSGNENQ